MSTKQTKTELLAVIDELQDENAFLTKALEKSADKLVDTNRELAQIKVVLDTAYVDLSATRRELAETRTKVTNVRIDLLMAEKEIANLFGCLAEEDPASAWFYRKSRDMRRELQPVEKELLDNAGGVRVPYRKKES